MRAIGFFLTLIMIPITILFALLGIIGFLASYINPDSMILAAFCGLLLPGLLVINFLLFIYWIFRKEWWGLIPILVILLNFNYFLSIFQFNSCNSENQNTSTLRIATYNVGNFQSWTHELTQEDIAFYMRQKKVNIICFQEYKVTSQISSDSLGKILNLPYHATSYTYENSYGKYGSAIFSKYPILAFQKIPIQSQSNDALWVDLKIGQDTIRVFNCHLQTTDYNRKQKDFQKQPSADNLQRFGSIYQALSQNFKQRAQQAEIIRQLIDTTRHPIIICGDFNDTPGSYTYHVMKGHLKDGFRTNGQGYGYTFRGIRKLLRIDFILYAPKFKGICYESPHLEWSDHNPVIMDLLL